MQSHSFFDQLDTHTAPGQRGLPAAWLSFRSLEPDGRAENQDNLVLLGPEGQSLCLRDQQPLTGQRADWPQGRMRLAVLDGMGGHAQGREVAERIAIELLQLPALQKPEALYRQLDALHQRLFDHYARQTGQASPGATLTLLEIPQWHPQGCEAWLYHVGDSRLYELPPDGPARCLSIDHVPATRLAMGGYLDHAEWQQQVFAQNRSTISQAFAFGNTLAHPQEPSAQEHRPDLLPLGPDNLPAWLAPMADRRTLTLRPGHRYLLASDGLWNVVHPDQLVARWPDLIGPETEPLVALHALAEALAEASNPDDIPSDNTTAILLPMANQAANPEPASRWPWSLFRRQSS